MLHLWMHRKNKIWASSFLRDFQVYPKSSGLPPSFIFKYSITRHKFTKVHGLILNFPAPQNRTFVYGIKE